MGRPKPASVSFRASFILDEINYKFKRRKKQLYQQLPGKRGNLAWRCYLAARNCLPTNFSKKKHKKLNWQNPGNIYKHCLSQDFCNFIQPTTIIIHLPPSFREGQKLGFCSSTIQTICLVTLHYIFAKIRCNKNYSNYKTIFCERFQPWSHFISRLSMIVRMSVVLTRTVVDSRLTVTGVTTCTVVILRVKLSCITSVDCIKLWLLTWLVNWVVMILLPG